MNVLCGLVAFSSCFWSKSVWENRKYCVKHGTEIRSLKILWAAIDLAW